MALMALAYFLATTLRLSLYVGVNSSVSEEKSWGRIVNFWILAALEGHTLPSALVALMASVMLLIQASSRPAPEMVVISGAIQAFCKRAA